MMTRFETPPHYPHLPYWECGSAGAVGGVGMKVNEKLTRRGWRGNGEFAGRAFTGMQGPTIQTCYHRKALIDWPAVERPFGLLEFHLAEPSLAGIDRCLHDIKGYVSDVIETRQGRGGFCAYQSIGMELFDPFEDLPGNGLKQVVQGAPTYLGLTP